MPLLLAFAAVLFLLEPALAQAPGQPVPPQQTEEWRRAEQFAREGVEKFIRSFESVLEAMPYGAPRVDEDGNIVIPRQHPRPLPPGNGRDGTTRT
jgi:hypothetical protein